MRHYEVMIILDPATDERNVQPSLENFLNVIRNSGGSVEKVEVWGKRRLSFEINKQAEGIYAVLDVNAEPDAVKEMDRQLSLSESSWPTPRHSCPSCASGPWRSRRTGSSRPTSCRCCGTPACSGSASPGSGAARR
ncbi:30S ribosomal protein S6 [Kibdelosporangium lantanae]|uniref:Small ribosomal subunit protein bS6 n=1 Tax=Kibdelosporangium lantanae TaxID=1497396 RepID=A0ABW3MI54_9PSEU